MQQHQGGRVRFTGLTKKQPMTVDGGVAVMNGWHGTLLSSSRAAVNSSQSRAAVP